MPTTLHQRARQRGATLVVGLVVLLVLTVVGISGMNMATFEINMAANVQFQQDAFQISESGIDTMIATRDYAVGGERVLDWIGGTELDRRAVTAYRTNTDVPDAAFSTGEVEAFHFDVVSVGRGPRSAESEHVQSFYVIGPAL